MTDTIAARLEERGITLGPPPAAAGVYTATVTVGDLLFTSGQVAADAEHGLLARGLLGREVDVPTGVACARQCAINVVAQVAAALGSLDRVRRVVKLTVFVAGTPEFTEQPIVANGASELIVDIFGEIGVHARSAVGVAALPAGSPVEVEAVFRIEAAVA
ncbi:RidA family protein [Nocardia sp. BMG111209]|uniref:RidA family protein n=1 Tax=Nocardia sp. BMG111209 TaxID=1160137 RepID=UPI00038183E1|nr:RidA family protein [Nocardia sp. BMG111209]